MRESVCAHTAKTSAVVLALLIISHRSGRELLSDRIAYHVCAPTITICWNRERLVAVFASLGQPHHQRAGGARNAYDYMHITYICSWWYMCRLVMCSLRVHPSRVWCLWEIITTWKGSVNQADWRVFDTDELLVATLLSVQIYYGKKFAPFAAKFERGGARRDKSGGGGAFDTWLHMNANFAECLFSSEVSFQTSALYARVCVKLVRARALCCWVSVICVRLEIQLSPRAECRRAVWQVMNCLALDGGWSCCTDNFLRAGCA